MENTDRLTQELALAILGQAPSVAWAVNISSDGRLAVAGFGDGTLRWFRLQDGAELLALFPHPDGRWVAWTPQGFYRASAGGYGFLCPGRGLDRQGG